LLATIDGAERAYIYGSWAARYRGEPGPVPGDLDVLVVGTADPDDVFEAAGAAERRLGREVNVRIVTPATWSGPAADPFLQSVRTRPLVELDLTNDRAA
jgi:predicted nucleotidyltransferase